MSGLRFFGFSSIKSGRTSLEAMYFIDRLEVSPLRSNSLYLYHVNVTREPCSSFQRGSDSPEGPATFLDERKKRHRKNGVKCFSYRSLHDRSIDIEILDDKR
ncbi:hypothetical protein ElyMa_005727200 [Elysia marginata]|uniref:Uncharacterized protein n=1 Tax=Elysia marginata TaxID=1093978 RepID=A0AAV4FK32_9GAST|nr:hypothetical protein ElyMa_005727200 [Elysia marginata]